MWEAVYVLLKFKPQKVMGFGGRDTFFILFWARIFFIDTCIYEPNASMGRANRVLSLFVSRVNRGFHPAKSSYQRGVSSLWRFAFNVVCPPNKRIEWVGIPIRRGLKKLAKPEAKRILQLDINLPVILCFGGSQGSEFINNAFKELVRIILKKKFQIIHITGSKQYEDFLEFYGKINTRVLVYSFCKEMEFLYSAADVVISRAGACTLAEISFYGIPAVFIPYPGAGRHQYENALYAGSHGACRIVTQENFSLEIFRQYVEDLLDNKDICGRIISNLKRLNIAVNELEFCHSVNQPESERVNGAMKESRKKNET